MEGSIRNTGKRDLTIDLLRFIGLSLIILAHVGPSSAILELRSFDVPMMLFVSGLAYSGREPDFSLNFFWHRFKRLLIPVWLFLVCYFILIWIAQGMLKFDLGVRIDHVVGSFLLMEGIGFVWIIRVFLIVAFLTPLILWLNHEVKSELAYMLILVLTAVSTTLIVYFHIGLDFRFVSEFVVYALGYGAMFALGVRVKNLGIKRIFAYSAIIICILLCYGVYNRGWSGLLCFNKFKYPPQLYFLLWGAGMSLLLYGLLKKRDLTSMPIWMGFIASNTIWIYLYHIPFVQITGMLGLNWGLRYFVVYLLAVGLCYLQSRLVDRYKEQKRYLRYLQG